MAARGGEGASINADEAVTADVIDGPADRLPAPRGGGGVVQLVRSRPVVPTGGKEYSDLVRFRNSDPHPILHDAPASRSPEDPGLSGKDGRNGQEDP